MEITNRPFLLPPELVDRAGLGALRSISLQEIDDTIRGARQGTDAFSALHQLRRLVADDAGGKSVLVASADHKKQLTASLRTEPEAVLEILARVGRSQQPAADAVVALEFLEKEGSASLIRKAWEQFATTPPGGFGPQPAAPLLNGLIGRLLTSPGTAPERLAELGLQMGEILRPETPHSAAFGVGILGRAARQSEGRGFPWWKFPAVGSQASRDSLVDGLVKVVERAVVGKLATNGELHPLTDAITDLATIGTPKATAALAKLATTIDLDKLDRLDQGATAALWMGLATEIGRTGHGALLEGFARGILHARQHRSAIEFSPFQNLVGLDAGLRELANAVADKPSLAVEARRLLDSLIQSPDGKGRDFGRMHAVPYFVDTPAHAIQLASAYRTLGDNDMALALATHAASTSIALINGGGQPPYQPEVAPALTDALALLRELGVKPGDLAPQGPSSNAPAASWRTLLQMALPRIDNLKREATNEEMLKALREEATPWIASASPMNDARLALFAKR